MSTKTRRPANWRPCWIVSLRRVDVEDGVEYVSDSVTAYVSKGAAERDIASCVNTNYTATMSRGSLNTDGLADTRRGAGIRVYT